MFTPLDCQCRTQENHDELPPITKSWATYQAHRFTQFDIPVHSIYIVFSHGVIPIGTVLPTEDGEWYWILSIRVPGVIGAENYPSAERAIIGLVEEHGRRAADAIYNAVMDGKGVTA